MRASTKADKSVDLSVPAEWQEELAEATKGWRDADKDWFAAKEEEKRLKKELHEKQQALNCLCCRLTAPAPLFEANGEAEK